MRPFPETGVVAIHTWQLALSEQERLAGNAAFKLEDYPTAEQHYRESVRVCTMVSSAAETEANTVKVRHCWL